MNPCDVTHCVPEWQAVWGLISVSVAAFVTGCSVTIFAFTLMEERKKARLSPKTDYDSTQITLKEK